MRSIRRFQPLLLVQLWSAAACSTYRSALAPALPTAQVTPAVGQVPDSLLIKVIREGDLIVLGTPLDIVSDYGVLTPAFQLGAKETWYQVKVAVDSVIKGKIKSAKYVDLGMLPAALTPPQPFGRLAKNEIVVQYPAVTFIRSRWANAATLVPGERAVFIFNRCYYCLPISGIAHGRGPYYTANPLVAQGWGSKLDPAEWPRVTRLVAEIKQHRRR
jgi:hypothetical protein